MIRLREQTSDDPIVEAGIALLRETSATSPNLEMKRRVWTALASKDTGRVVVPRMFRVPVIASAAVVLFAAGTAGAVIARRFIVPALHHSPPAADPVVPAPAPPPRKVAMTRASAPEPVVVAEAAPPVRQNRPHRVMAPLPSVTHDNAVAAPTPRERAQVLDAMIALRRDHDAARAGQLLDNYLTARPHGALREEALALAIEAADARGDRVSVATWARAYQTDYPTGRFAGYARSHLNAQ